MKLRSPTATALGFALVVLALSVQATARSDVELGCEHVIQNFKTPDLHHCSEHLALSQSDQNSFREQKQALDGIVAEAMSGSSALSATLCSGGVAEAQSNLEQMHTRIRESVGSVQNLERSFYRRAMTAEKILKRYFGLKGFDWDDRFELNEQFVLMIRVNPSDRAPYLAKGLGEMARKYFRIKEACGDPKGGRTRSDISFGDPVCSASSKEWYSSAWSKNSNQTSNKLEAYQSVRQAALAWASLGVADEAGWYMARESLARAMLALRQIEFVAKRLGSGESCEALVAEASQQASPADEQMGRQPASVGDEMFE